MLTGLLNYVFVLKKNNKEMILKVYRSVEDSKSSSFSKEAYGYKIAKKQGIPVPKIYQVSKKVPYVLMERKKEKNIRYFLLDEDIPEYKKNRILAELIHYLIKLNKVKGKQINSYDYTSKKLKETENKIKKVNRLKTTKETKEILCSVFESLQNRKKYFNEKVFSVFLQRDLNPFNILVDENSLKISAILDWEKSSFGHPMEDIGRLLRFSWFGYYNILKENYKKSGNPINEEQLNFFKDLYNLDFALDYILRRKKYNFMPKAKRKFYNILVQNNLNRLKECC
jgi:aminoglycoside phosphotransferase (APT) family kinase protein